MKTISGSELGILAQIASERDPNTKLLAQLSGETFWVACLILNVDTKLPKRYHNQKGRDLRHLAHAIKEMVIPNPVTPTDALKEFVSCIESTGGVVQDRTGLVAPVADEEWIDIGEAYLKACKALGREPMYKK